MGVNAEKDVMTPEKWASKLGVVLAVYVNKWFDSLRAFPFVFYTHPEKQIMNANIITKSLCKIERSSLKNVYRSNGGLDNAISGWPGRL